MSFATIAASAGRRRDLPLALLVAASMIAYGIAPTTNGTVTCLLRLHVGHACPGCGLSRATGRLFRGDLLGAFAYHPWVFALAVQAVAFAAWRYHWGNRALTARQQLVLLWSVSANVVLLFLVWSIRIATGHLDGVY